MPVHANFDAHEGVIQEGEITIELLRKSKAVTITNDSDAVALKFKFNRQEQFGTLYPNESVCLDDLWTTQVFLKGSGVEYRVWAYG